MERQHPVAQCSIQAGRAAVDVEEPPHTAARHGIDLRTDQGAVEARADAATVQVGAASAPVQAAQGGAHAGMLAAIKEEAAAALADAAALLRKEGAALTRHMAALAALDPLASESSLARAQGPGPEADAAQRLVDEERLDTFGVFTHFVARAGGRGGGSSSRAPPRRAAGRGNPLGRGGDLGLDGGRPR